jgi:hypothetical protein
MTDLKTLTAFFCAKGNMVIWESMSATNKASEIKLQSTQKLRLFNMLLSSTTGMIDLKKA